MTADGVGCGAGKGKCASGACVWTETGRQWGLVPSGTFQMGCNEVLDKFCESDEKPQHAVTITSSYWLGLYEVTVTEYAACVSAGVCTAPDTTGKTSYWCKDVTANNWSPGGPKAGRGSHPVNCVYWSQAKAYCSWAGGRLPSEAEWELAARGRCEENGGSSGCAAAMRTYPWGETPPVCGKQAVFYAGGDGCGVGTTWAVGSGSGSGVGPYGHFDLSGNVWERVSGYYDHSFYSKAEATALNPMNNQITSVRVDCGGGFGSNASYLRAGDRSGYPASGAYFDLGFRCVRSYP